MSTSASTSDPGAAIYSTNTLHVGDGTWDAGRDSFLLPNLMGVNFATMQYNGMGNRFRGLDQYHRLIIGHGVLAAITFLAVVPSAIFLAKFYRRKPRVAVKMHVYLQVLTVFLSTVVLALGWFAVGPERSLTNPHHVIGLTIYVCVLVQFLYGWLMMKLERRRKNVATLIRVPKKIWLHRLFGRAIALLGIVQIALGLTLYGSPKSLFILYALLCFFLLVAYLLLDRRYFQKRAFEVRYEGGHEEIYSDYGSYLSGSRTDYHPPPPRERREGSRERNAHWPTRLLAGAGVLGAYEAWKHGRNERRGRQEQESQPSGISPPGVVYGAGGVPAAGGWHAPHAPPPVPRYGSRSRSRLRRPDVEESRLSPESWQDEKYSERPQRSTWRDRTLGAGIGIGAIEGVRRLFSRRKKLEEDYLQHESSPPSLQGSQNLVSQTDVSRVEQGHAPMSPPNNQRVNMAGVAPMTPTATPSRPPRNRPFQRPSADSLSYSSSDEVSILRREDAERPQHLASPSLHHQEDESHTLRSSIANLGILGGLREWQRHRKERTEQRRADKLRRQDMDEEMYIRRTSGHYPLPPEAGGRKPSQSGTLLTGPSVAPAGGADHGFVGSNPELSRTNFTSTSRPDTSLPPFPATAGAVPIRPFNGPSTTSPGVSQQRIHEATQLPAGYQLPPPPPGPPPASIRLEYVRPEPGSLQMPQGAITPDPSRLMSTENVTSTQTQEASSSHAATAAAAQLFADAAAANLASSSRRRRNSQAESPSRFSSRLDSRTRLQRPLHRRRSSASGSVSQVGTPVLPAALAGEANPSSPLASVKVKVHNGGRHTTLWRLNEEEAAAERAARRAEQRQRRRKSSEVGSGGLESDGGNAPSGSNARYRRNGNRQPGVIRRSSDQPITNIPLPPPMSSTAGSHRPPSELNIPTPIAAPAPQSAAAAAAPLPPQHSTSPHGDDGLSPPLAAPQMSGMSGSPGEAGTGTDVSAFDNNRRRRRAERARRLEAARGGNNGAGNVDFT